MTQTTSPAAHTFNLVTRGAGRATHIAGHQKHTTWCNTEWNAASGMQYTTKAGTGVPTCKTCRKMAGLDK